MRTLLGISIATVIAVTVWWTLPIHAKQQFGTVSIDPLSHDRHRNQSATRSALRPRFRFSGTAIATRIHFYRSQ